MDQEQFKQLLLTNDGRIARQQWWIGTLAIIVASIVGGIIIAIISFGNGVIGSVLRLVLHLVLLYPIYNIGIKRRHDRDNDGKDLLTLLAVGVLLDLLAAIGFDGFFMGVFNLAVAVFGIYMLVQLGILEGTKGPNSYGPDPLGD